jgi:hypothetical protein
MSRSVRSVDFFTASGVKGQAVVVPRTHIGT